MYVPIYFVAFVLERLSWFLHNLQFVVWFAIGQFAIALVIQRHINV